jgi:transcriptional regulator with XRE-family HTH domain
MTVRLDRDRLDRQMAVRGLTARRLAALAGVAEATVSRARNGRTVAPTTMRKLVEALDGVAVVPGAAELLTEPKTAS